jgi:hypothetical protein
VDPEAEFRASRVRALWLILASLGFVAVGIWAGRSGAWAGWVAVAFFGVCLLVAIVQVITAGRTFLKLDRRGFVMVQWGGRRQEVSWSDIESFSVANLIWTKVIASYQNAGEVRSVVRLLTRAQGVGGFDGIIPNQYTDSPETICAALNEWKHRYG